MSQTSPYPNAVHDDVRPVVRTATPSKLGPWIFGAIILIGGLALFLALNSRRQDLAASSTLPAGQGGGMIASPPPLSLPASFPEYALETGPRLRPVRPLAITPVPSAPPRVITRTVQPSLSSLGPDDLSAMGLQRIPPPGSTEPPPSAPPPQFVASSQPDMTDDRVSAGRLANPGLTVPKGTIVAAVLETALDSTRPGAVRAIVSRDVKGFDGTRVLIPRGSRLYGEYNSDVTSGQNRALIRWQRLTRPDAVVINLDSPSADPLGRAGVRGKVDSHFFARFGSAILQSVLDIGVGLATRSVSNEDTVIVGLPGSTQQVTGQLAQTVQVQPTLRVRHGTSVSVFVARDLDFSTVDD
jgi:type IV secretion system protein VirB10